MRLLVILISVTLAQAATLPQTNPIKNIEEPIKDDQKQPLDNISSDPELIDQVNIVNDVGNNLKKQSIPVQVIQANDVKKVVLNEVGIDTDDVNIKRVEVDLKNPGPPQRIEHDNQNPEHFDDGQSSLDNINIKQDIIDTSNNVNDNAQNIQQSIQGWLESNQNFAAIQKNFQDMKASIDAQISHMNQTIQKFWVPAAANIQSVAEGAQQNIHAGLKTLEKNVQSGMKILTEEIKAIGATNDGSVKASVKQGETPTAPVNNQNNQWWNQFQFQNFYNQWSNFTTNIQQQMTNIQNQITQQGANGQGSSPQNDFFANIQQTLFPPSKPAGAESDEPQRPNIWQGIQSFFQGQPATVPVENDPVQGSAPPKRPIVQAIQNGIQNNPIVQGVQSIIGGNSPAQPTKPETPAPAASEGTNAVPEKPETEAKPDQPALLSQSGPIRDAIEKNPIVQSLAGAVQRIQHTIRPTSPRENEQKGYHKPGSSDDEHHNSGVVKSESKPEPSSEKEPAKIAETPEKEEKPAKADEKPTKIEKIPVKIKEIPNVEKKVYTVVKKE